MWAIVMTNLNTFPAAETPQVIEQLMALYQDEVNKREAERQHVAAFLNDTAVQTLSALHIQLSLLPTAPEAQLRRDLANALPLLADLMSTLHNLTRELRPVELDTLKLQDILQLAVETFTQPDRLRITYEGAPAPDLPVEVTTAFYRLAQEVLSKVQEDEQATEVLIRLQTTNGRIHLTIQDNGGTMDDDATPELGLLGLMVRFARFNGRLTLHSQADAGTVVTAVWPWTES